MQPDPGMAEWEVATLRDITRVVARHSQEVVGRAACVNAVLLQCYHTSIAHGCDACGRVRTARAGPDTEDLGVAPLRIRIRRIVDHDAVPRKVIPRPSGLPLEDDVVLPTFQDLTPEGVGAGEETASRSDRKLINTPDCEPVRPVPEIEPALDLSGIRIVPSPLLDLLREGIGRDHIEACFRALLDRDLRRVVPDATVIAPALGECSELRIGTRELPAGQVRCGEASRAPELLDVLERVREQFIAIGRASAFHRVAPFTQRLGRLTEGAVGLQFHRAIAYVSDFN